MKWSIKVFGREISFAMLVFAAIFIVAAIMLIVLLTPPKEDFSDYKTESQSASVSKNLPDNPINFEELKKSNPDVCGWITVEGTNIDYPVLQSGMGKPEDFYLDHDWLKEDKKAGSIYIQRLNGADFGDRNTVLYGHNMKNGSMFGALKKFKDKNYFNAHRNITVCVPNHKLEYKIYSAFVYSNQHLFAAFDRFSDAGIKAFIAETLEPTRRTHYVDKEVSVSENDRFITLSTCTSADSERYLVVAVLQSDTKTK